MILVYDSGLGGLSSLNNLIKKYTEYDFIFFGDRDNAPYGNRSISELRQLFSDNLNNFKQYEISDVIVQCNTLCSSLDFNAYSLPLHDIIAKTLDVFTEINRNSSILVVGTCLTIKQGRYQNSLHKMGFNNVDAYPLKDLATMIEHYTDENIIKDYLLKMLPLKKYDYVILACTHYPFYKEIFSSLFNAKIIDSTNLTYKFNGEKNGSGKLYLKLIPSLPLKNFLDKHLEVPYKWL